MRRLIVMRHAKSAWDAEGLADHARPLARRGRLAAALMGAWLAEIAAEDGFTLDLALVSDSLRTQETWALLARHWGGAAELRLEPRIYEAPAAALYAAVRDLPARARTVLMLGHNPGVQTWTAAATGRAPLTFTTAAVAVLGADSAWADAADGGFRLLRYEEPKGLV